MFQRPGPYVEVHHGGGHEWFGLLLMLVLLAALALAAVTLWRTYRQPPLAVTSAAAPAPAPPPPDPALAELRLRYARGDIDRDDYLLRATDLGDVIAPAPAESPSGDA
jgi:putative membrane protein